MFPKDLKAKIIAHLRRIGYLNITYKKSMASAHRGYGQWECASCKVITTRQDLHGDHIEPVVDPVAGFVDWNTYLARLFLGTIQPICKVCHKAKSKAENKVRRQQKNAWEEIE